VSKNYQKSAKKDTAGTRVSVPEQVTIALAELTGQVQEGLLSLAVATGLSVMGQLMEADVEELAGPKGAHLPGRAAVRHGSGPGSVTLGGRRVPVVRPRVRAADGSGELPVPSYDLFSSTELLGRLAMGKMLAGLSTRRYPVGLEPVGSQVEQAATGVSKSAISRRFVAGTETALAELMCAELGGLDLVALMIDGVHFADHLCVVALGIDSTGTKHPLALVEGSTENTTLVRELLVGLRERGLDTSRPILAVLDGSKALAAGIREVFDRPVIARCQIHKMRNVRDKLPEKMRGVVESRMRAAYGAGSELEAKALLENLARELDKTRPGAAASLREGLDETLTVLRLGVPPTLARSLRSTNAIESMIGICREHARNVKRWRDGQMALRWCAAGMVEASGQFRRVNGHMHLPKLRAELERVTNQNVSTQSNTESVEAA
jgi:putative transposase